MTDFLTLFHFIRPLWFLAIIPLIVLTVLLWLSQKSNQQWQRFISPHLLPYLLDNTQIKQKRWPILGVSLLWLATIFSLAGPAWKKIPQPVEQNISALVICWDLSPSMLAEDIKPSRLLRSRLKIIDLLNSHKDGQVALVAFSGEAYTVTPLTDDIQTIINLLPALSPTTLPTTGSNPEMALDQAQQLLKDAGIIKGNILFITDEIDESAFDFFEDQLQHSPHQLTIWGVGTKEGAPIPLPSGGFAKAKDGMVVAKLNENALISLTSKIGAYYISMQTLDNDIKSITQLLSTSLDQQTKKTERVFDLWMEHGQYLVIFLLPFIAFLFRKGWIFTFVFFVALPMLPTQPVYAFGWKDLWETQDQQAQKALESGDQDAAMNFSSYDRRGAELFKQGKYDQSSKEFTQGKLAEDAYNNGNALTQLGKYEEAIKAFEEALAQQPSFKDAEDNLNIAKQLAELAKKQQQQQGDDGEKQEGDKNDQDQQDQNKQDSDNNQQGDQSKQDQSKQDKSDQQQSSEKNQDSSENSDQQVDPNQKGNEPKPEDNPYSKENTEQNKTEEQAQKEAQEKKEAEQKEGQQAKKAEEDKQLQELTEEQAKALAEAMEMTDEEKEQKQKLETWLRKVPDDPSGLMRNKFQYEYNKRRQGLETSTPYSNQDPEERW